MIPIRLRTNLAQFKKGLSDAHRRQVPFAVVTAVNTIATGVRGDIVASMLSTFDRPTPFTLNATYVKRARKSDMTAFLGIREFAGKGTPAWKYLGPQMDGGDRQQKRFERRLASLTNGASFAVPASGAELDAFGNLSRGQIVKILSALGTLGDASATPVSGKRRRRKGRLAHSTSKVAQSPYFLARAKGNGRPLAIYELTEGGSAGHKGKVKPILWLTDQAPAYQARWPLRQVVLTSIAAHRVDAFAKAWELALATAR